MRVATDRPNLVRFLCALSVAMALAGCSTSPQGGLPSVSAHGATGSRANPTLPSSLLYLIHGYGKRGMSMLSFPEGQPVGKKILMPTVAQANPCSDNKGNVFVPADGWILEYAHGGRSPIAVLKGASQPSGCASDPVTGNLAVTIFPNHRCTIQIYKGATGNPQTLHDKHFPYCDLPTYDDRGDLFFQAENGSRSVLGELPAGSSAFTSIKLNTPIPTFWYLQWDGADVAIAAPEQGSQDLPVVIFRVQVVCTNGTVIAKLHFDGWTRQEWTFWIQDGMIVAPLTTEYLKFGVWRYTQNGKLLDTFSVPGEYVGMTVSKTP